MSHPSIFLNGQWEPGLAEPFERLDPVSGTSLWQGNAASEAQVDRAVSAARQAFPDWRRRPLEERVALLETFADSLRKQKDSLTQALGEESGKPLWESATEIDAMIGKIGLSVQAFHERTGVHEKSVAAGLSRLQHRPHGVLAVLGPYNFPGHLPNGHIVPALLAGNTVVFKPSEQVPRFAERMVQLWAAAGVPAGVINLVQGARPVGEALAGHPDIDGLLFTGSSATGVALHRQLAGQPDKILALEMGGNNPLILAGEWPLEGALHHVLFSAFVTAGQRCTCARRLLVPEGSSGDQFLERLLAASRDIRVGRYNEDPQPFMGALISPAARDAVLRAWKELQQLGGQSLLEPVTPVSPDAGPSTDGTVPALLTPGLIDVTAIGDLPDREIFGPVLQIQRYQSFDEALDLANRTRYGLAAGLISDDPGLFEQFSREIRAGIVNWNKPLTGASSAAPFGGVGLSGNHRPGAWYAADYCAWPMASLVDTSAVAPGKLSPGLPDLSGGRN